MVSPPREQVCLAGAELVPDAGIELGVVLGGGNLFRGAALSEAGMDRVVGDRMGMLATIMNALALGDFLTREGISNQIYTATGIPGIAPAYERDQAKARLEAALEAGNEGSSLVKNNNATDLVEHAGPAVSPPNNAFKADPGAAYFAAPPKFCRSCPAILVFALDNE